MSKEQLLALAERCEAATGLRDDIATLQLKHEIATAMHEQGWHPAACLRQFVSSIDAALTLVPEGWWVAGLYFCHPDFRSENDREWCAELAGPVTWAVVDREVGEEPHFPSKSGTAATPALALCAAALRARARASVEGGV